MNYEQAKYNLQVHCVRLQETNGQGWSEFCNSLELLSHLVNEQLLQSSPDRLVANQGRALMMRDLVVTIALARQMVEQVQQQASNNVQHPIP